MQLVDGISKGRACFEGNHRTICAALDVALKRLVFFEAVGHDGFTLAGCQNIRAQTDDAARRDVKLDVDTLAHVLHGGHFALAARHHVDHLGGELCWHVDGQFFNRLTFLAIDFLINNLWLSHLQFVAFATHCLDEDRKVEHTATADNPAALAIRGAYAQGEVFLEFLVQTLGDVA